MSQALCNSDHEQVVGILGVVLRQLSQHRGQSSVICASSNQTHGKNSVVSNFGITIVRELAESVQNVQFRV